MSSSLLLEILWSNEMRSNISIAMPEKGVWGESGLWDSPQFDLFFILLWYKNMILRRLRDNFCSSEQEERKKTTEELTFSIPVYKIGKYPRMIFHAWLSPETVRLMRLIKEFERISFSWKRNMFQKSKY